MPKKDPTEQALDDVQALLDKFDVTEKFAKLTLAEY